MHSWLSLHMMSLLLLLAVPTSWSSRCVSLEAVNSRLEKHLKRWKSLDTRGAPNSTRRCAEAATQMHVSERALSPWKYSLNQDEDRSPQVIAFAECLCRGCIINQQEDMSYNSVLVHAAQIVRRRTPCPSNPDQYAMKWDVIQVPVACTCVIPKY